MTAFAHEFPTHLDSDASIAQLALEVADVAARLEPDLMAEVWLVDPDLRKLERLALAPRKNHDDIGLELAWEDTVLGGASNDESQLRIFSVDRDERLFTRRDRERMPSARALYCLSLSGGPGHRPYRMLCVWSPGTPSAATELQSALAIIGRRFMEAHRRTQVKRTLEARLAIMRAFQVAESVRDFAERLVWSVMPDVFDSAAASIFLVNEADDRLNSVASTGIVNLDGEQTTWYVRGEGITGSVWRLNQTLRILPENWETIQYDDQLLTRVGNPSRPPKSRETLPAGIRPQLLAVPLSHRGRVVGVLRLTGQRHNARYSVEDEIRARELSEDLGASFVRRQAADRDGQHSHTLILLGEELQKETEETTALRLLLAAVSCGKGLAFNRAAIWTSDAGRSKLEPALVVGHRDGREAHRVWETIGDLTLEEVLERARGSPIDHGSGGAFRAATVPLSDSARDVLNLCFAGADRATAIDAADLNAEREGDLAIASVFEPETFTVVPVRGDRECLGVLYADNIFDRKPIDPVVISVLTKLARLGGLAVERIRDARSRRELADSHTRLTAAIVEESDADSRVNRVLKELHRHFRFEKWLLYCHDQKTRLVNILGSRGFDLKLHPLLTFDVGLDNKAVTPRVVRDQTEHYTAHAESDPEITPFWRETLGLKGPVLVYPLRAGANVYGVLVINDARLTKAHVEQLNLFVNELATAVTVAMLDHNLSQRNKFLDLIQSTQTAFVHAFADEPWFLHELAFRMKNITGAKLCAIHRRSSRGTEDQPLYARVVALGYPNPEDDDARTPATGPMQGLTNHVLAGLTVNVPLVARDDRWSGGQQADIEKAIGPHRSFLGVPLRNRLAGTSGATVGAITLTRARTSESDGLAFQEADATLVEAVATAVSSYLTLKDALNELDRQLKALKGLHAFGQRLTPLAYRSDGEDRPLLEAIAEDAGQMFQADVVVVYPHEPAAPPAPPIVWKGGVFRNEEAALKALRESQVPRQVAAIRTTIYERDVGKRHATGPSDGDGTEIFDRVPAPGEGIVAFAWIPFVQPAAADLDGPGDILGVMVIGYRAPHQFGPSERLAIEAFASYAALALHSAGDITDLMQSRESEFGEFYGNLAHELRNLLVTIPGAIEAVLRVTDRGDLPSHAICKLLERALDHAQRAQRVVADLQQLSPARARLNRSATTSTELLSALEATVRGEAGDEAEVSVESSLSSAVAIQVDSDQMFHDFINLAKDSIRHRVEERKLQIRITFLEAAPPEVASRSLASGRYLKVVYSDNGTGIAPASKELVFKRFHTTTGGMGLGLTLARQNAIGHGGNIWETGNFGAGVRFELFLPIESP